MTAPSRTAAVGFTATSLIALTEMTLTALYLPYPILTIALGAVAALLAWLAATEWTALHHRSNR